MSKSLFVMTLLVPSRQIYYIIGEGILMVLAKANYLPWDMLYCLYFKTLSCFLCFIVLADIASFVLSSSLILVFATSWLRLYFCVWVYRFLALLINNDQLVILFFIIVIFFFFSMGNYWNTSESQVLFVIIAVADPVPLAQIVKNVFLYRDIGCWPWFIIRWLKIML